MAGGLTKGQRNVASRALRRARRKGATKMEQKALIEAGLVESNMTHLEGGDRDSTGFLQQRPSQGWGPVGESVERDVDQFLKEARKHRGKATNAGQLAQLVQRSAFPERYGQRGADADRILRSLGGSAGPTPATQRTPGVRRELQMSGNSRAGQRVALTMDFLNDKADVLDLAAGLEQLQDEPGETLTYELPGERVSRPAKPVSGRKKGKLGIAEMFYDKGISMDNGQRVGSIGGHGSHVHVAARDGDTMMELYRMAREESLAVREFKSVDPVDPVHTEGSFHYEDTKTSKGRTVGQAMDVSGNPQALARFNRRVARRARRK